MSSSSVVLSAGSVPFPYPAVAATWVPSSTPSSSSRAAVAWVCSRTRCPGEDPKNTKVKPGVGMIAARTGVQILPVFIGMKDQKWKFFRRVRIVVGEPIPFERFGYDKEQPGEYARISAEVFAEICRLGDTLK